MTPGPDRVCANQETTLPGAPDKFPDCLTLSPRRPPHPSWTLKRGLLVLQSKKKQPHSSVRLNGTADTLDEQKSHGYLNRHLLAWTQNSLRDKRVT